MLRSWCNRCLGSRGDGLLWHMDLRPHASGDFSIAVVQANSSLEDQSQVYTSPSATYVGIYDGHGGPEASRFVNRHLFPYLHKFSTEQGGLSPDVIRKAFSATEEEFTRLVKRSLPLKPQIASVGSCCLVGTISNGELYVANLGDSRAVLGRRGFDGEKNLVAERLTTDHNVSYEGVRKEVEALHPDDSSIVVYCRGVWRIKGIIQVSRSIGDIYLKKPEFHRDPNFQQYGNYVPMKRPVLTAEPSIVKRKLSPQDLFLIFASDGLWEHLSDDAAVQIVSKYPRAVSSAPYFYPVPLIGIETDFDWITETILQGIAKRLVAVALQEAAKKREMRYRDIKKIERGIRRHFHDDISVIVIYLDHHKNSTTLHRKQAMAGFTTAPVDIFSFKSDEVELEPMESQPRVAY